MGKAATCTNHALLCRQIRSHAESMRICAYDAVKLNAPHFPTYRFPAAL